MDAGRCAEGENDLGVRGNLVGAASPQRYPDHSPEAWYFFCKRTGHGNVARLVKRLRAI